MTLAATPHAPRCRTGSRSPASVKVPCSDLIDRHEQLGAGSVMRVRTNEASPVRRSAGVGLLRVSRVASETSAVS
jgi:hypothetical protein